MANKIRGEVSVTIDGVAYTLVLDFNALCEFEEATGADDGWQRLALLESGRQSMRDVRALIWAMLRARHPEMTLQDAGDLISIGGEDVVEAMRKALAASTPEADPAKK